MLFAAVLAHGGAVSGSPPLCFGKVFGFTQDVMTFGNRDFVKYVVHGFLDTGVQIHDQSAFYVILLLGKFRAASRTVHPIGEGRQKTDLANRIQAGLDGLPELLK
jgi:hypothetical protein